MRLHLREPVVRTFDQLGAVCAYIIIVCMLAFAVAPVVAPLWPR